MLSTKTVLVKKDWELVTNKVACIQANEEIYLLLNEGEVPTEKTGFSLAIGESYTNGRDGIYVWAKDKASVGSGVVSVR